MRHGQASFGTSNYDKLSEIGIVQSQALGRFWVERTQQVDAVFSGVQQRQKHTLELVRDSYTRAGLHFPEPTVLDAFNEYDAEALMTQLYPRLLADDHRLQQLAEQMPNLGDASPEGRKAFQKSFEIVLHAWIEGVYEIETMESWKGFRARVVRGLRKITSQYPGSKNVAVFTSGGAISATLGYALDISNHKAMGLQWVIKNSSLTEFIFSGERFTLSGFNHIPHLGDDSLVTYR